MEVVGTLTVGIFATILAYILHGLALTSLWKWFIVPAFNAPAINIPQALGIGLVMGLLTRQYIKQDIEWAESIGFSIGFPLLIWLVGWIVHLFL